eukprot:TRINITY_DN7553_c0_g1_i1.p2 TRINITY_DN7553_c0_g1~~TRINITY_DN7553_c0_g1_i1.p2  ORF type:complete len:143 (+),score=4.84 TRINITY_DN7553_c0_g1_i1:403-831(+)
MHCVGSLNSSPARALETLKLFLQGHGRVNSESLRYCHVPTVHFNMRPPNHVMPATLLDLADHVFNLPCLISGQESRQKLVRLARLCVQIEVVTLDPSSDRTRLHLTAVRLPTRDHLGEEQECGETGNAKFPNQVSVFVAVDS